MKTETCNYDIVRFKDGNFELEVSVSPTEETVWLTQEQIALLFNVDRTRITRHIKSALEEGEISLDSNVRKTHFTGVSKPVGFYNLEVVIAVGYKVRSLRGVIFRRWANSVLKQY